MPFAFTDFFAPYARDVVAASSDGSQPEPMWKSVNVKGLPARDLPRHQREPERRHGKGCPANVAPASS